MLLATAGSTVDASVVQAAARVGDPVVLSAGPDPPTGPAGAIVADPTAWDRAVAAVDRVRGEPCALVTLPPPVEPTPFEGVDDDLWRRTVLQHLTVPMHLARATLPHLIAGGGGTVVFVAWDVREEGLAHQAAVSAAVGQLGRALAAEVGRQGVRVNTVCAPPGRLADAAPAIALALGAGYMTGEVLLTRTGDRP